ncbi:MAG: hypothetical protein IT452_09530 [Planctomycetia bacterium]|nr:hypothetical protein [Planctomycetia bacterium]
MKTLAAAVVVAGLLAGCRHYLRASGDLEVQIAGPERILDVDSGRTTLRILNRGACAVAVRHGEETFVLETTEDREIVLEGKHVLHFERRGEGEARVDVHFDATGRVTTVRLR